MTPLPSGLSTRPERFAPSSESNLRLLRAIESLNLNLDDELRRYRQTRSGQTAVPLTPARLPLRQTRKPVDLIAFKSAAPAAGKTTPPRSAPPAVGGLQEMLGQAPAPRAQAFPPKQPVNQVRLSHGGTLTTYRAAPEDYLESTEALLDSLPTRPNPPADSEGEYEYETSVWHQLTTPLGLGALLLLLVGSAGFGYLVTSPEAVSHLSNNPITRRFRGAPTDPTTLQNPGAPEDQLAQAEAGFRPMGPDLSEQEFTSLDLSRISTLPSTESSSSTQDLSPVDGSALPRAEPIDGAADRPDSRAVTTTARESGVLRATIVTAPSPAVGARPAPAAPSRAARSAPAPSSAAAPAQVQRVAPPAAIAQPPQPLAANRTPPAPLTPRTSASPPAPITQAPPAASPSYYVVTDYSGAQSLESARSAVSDAYVRNFSGGTRIQMGAFSQASSAQNLVNQLQGQGIPAQVISP